MSNRRNASTISPQPAASAEQKLSAYQKNISRVSAIASCVSLGLALLVICGAAAFGQTNESQPNLSPGAGQIFVHSQFGGQIFGFDIDQNGSEGLLAEAPPGLGVLYEVSSSGSGWFGFPLHSFGWRYPTATPGILPAE